jgi:hypothetical protein
MQPSPHICQLCNLQKFCLLPPELEHTSISKVTPYKSQQKVNLSLLILSKRKGLH